MIQNKNYELVKLQEENKKQQLLIQELESKNKSQNKKQLQQFPKELLQSNKFQILDAEIIENLEKIEEIGYGGGGHVFKVSLMNRIYALKEMNINNLNTKDFKNFIGEYEIMNMLKHPNIVRAFGIFLSNKKIPPCILLEFMPMNLATAIEKKVFNNVRIVFCIYQIVEGMKFIHFHNIIHRDLSPTNILVEHSGTTKISDFGIAKLITSETQTMTYGIGKVKFMAPEIVNEDEKCNEKVDVYSFGSVVFFILSGGLLPKIKMSEVFQGKKAEIPPTFTKLAKEIIDECWNFDPKDRPSFNSILEKMERNNYNLLKLNHSELEDVKLMIEQNKLQFKPYNKKKKSKI